ncbi:MAG: hypothetical protein KDA79_04950 [Planctomycetaceae bacterium]|nr:hypothetical protein [Planctomycetaceae bacterium]
MTAHHSFAVPLLVPAIIASCLCRPCAAGDAQPGEKPPAARQTIIRISRETTRITGPLDDAGFVDYAGAINQIAGKGVTPENNFEVVMRRVFGLDAIYKEYHDEYCRLLGIAKPVGPVGPIENFETFFPKASPPGEDSHQRWTRIMEEYDQLDEGPWTAAEHPEGAKWLKSIEPQLDALVQGSRRPRLFVPTFSNPEWSDPFVYSDYRSVARVLSGRAMFRLGNGDIEGAWSDLQAVHRVARLVGSGPRVLDPLVAGALESLALDGDRIVLQSHLLSDALARRFLADMKQLSPLPQMAPVLNVGERYWTLDVIQQLARQQQEQQLDWKGLIEAFGELTQSVTGVPPVVLLRSADQMVSFSIETPRNQNSTPRRPVVAPVPDFVLIEWNEILIRLNRRIDREVAALAEQDLKQQKKLTSTLSSDMKKTRRDTLELTESWTDETVGRPPQFQRVMENLLLIGLLQAESLPALASVERRDLARLEVTRLAFAAEVYQRDHSRYPETLDKLLPQYVAAVPVDPLSEQPLRYRQDIHGFTLYSVGRNERDDGGRDHYSPDSRGQDFDDIVIQIRKPRKESE